MPKNTLLINDLVMGQCGLWCTLPYEGHKNGCPNIGRAGCPPYTQFDFDLNKPIYFVYSEFDLVTHAARMLELHPLWSDSVESYTGRVQVVNRCAG